jgi:hypothetical protein
MIVNSIGLLIQHPSIDPARITLGLGVEATVSMRFGDPVITPKGRESGGRYKWSSWSYFDEDGSRDLSLRSDSLFALIRGNEELLGAITTDGGRITVIVRSNHDSHAFCEFDPTKLALLSRLSISLGFEVFPL